jgi:hypothetical protein
MLTNIESAGFYMLKPIDAIHALELGNSPAFPDEITEDVISVGGPLIMNEVAVYMDNKDVLATVGTFPDSCIILTDLPRDRCCAIVKLGKEVFDRKVKESVENNV